MNLQVVKETNYSQTFREVLESEQNRWLKNLREKAFAYFSENGFPTPANEEWKYTNVAPIAKEKFEISNGEKFDRENVNVLLSKTESENRVVFVNGIFNSELTNLSTLPEGAKILSLREALSDETFSSV